MTPAQYWLIVAIILFILEVITPGFVLANLAAATEQRCLRQMQAHKQLLWNLLDSENRRSTMQKAKSHRHAIHRGNEDLGYE